MAILRVLAGQNPGQELTLEGPRCVLGRHPNCDIKLEDGSVSREHAALTLVDGRWHLEDLNSRNGTFLNGRIVDRRQPLTDGDEVRICDLSFSFHGGAPLGGQTLGGAMLGLAAAVVEDPAESSNIMSKLDVSSSQSGFRLSIRPEAKLRALIEVTENLGASLGLDEVLQKTLDSAFKIFVQADRGFIALRDRPDGPLVPHAVKHRRGDGETIRISKTIVSQVLDARQAILSADAASDERFDMSQSIADYHIRSMMCAPLLDSENRGIGVIQIDTVDRRSRFQQEDLDVLAAVARQAAFAVENTQLHHQALRQQRVERDLALAHEVQQGFLPSERPAVPGYDFFDYYESASQLGGDYYDYVPLPGGRLAVVVADVSGKGIPAALLMARLSSEVRFCLATETSPARAVERLNAGFARPGWEDRFVTLALLVLEPESQRISLVNAGHLPPMLRRKNGGVEPLGVEASGVPLGVDNDVRYECCQVSLTPGEKLTLFTDGISEAMNPDGQLFGLERLKSRLAEPSDSVEAWGKQILVGVKQFVASRAQSDDMCLVCLGRKG